MIDRELQGEALRLRRRGLSYADIAFIWNVSKGTVHDIASGKGASRRMLNQIREKLGWVRMQARVLSPAQVRRRALQAELKALGMTLDEALALAIEVKKRGDW